MKFRKGDNVLIIAGSEKGKVGLIQKVIPATRHIIIQDINIKNKRVKPTADNPTQSLLRIEYPIHSSKVSHIDPRTGLRTKIKYKFMPDGTKIRVSKRTDEQI